MEYKYLDRRGGSNYRQFFYKGSKLRAETLYRETVGPEPRTPEQVAKDFNVPLEAVHEAIHYCTHNEDLLNEERERDIADMRARGILKPPLAPTNAKDGQ
jgi:hypothetical protein